MSADYRGITKNLFTAAFGKDQAEIQHLRERYARTKDKETLARIVELQGLPESSDIAEIIRNKRPDEKVFRDVKWREIDRLYFQWFIEEGITESETYERIRNIYFNDEEREETKSDDAIIVQHKRWAEKEYKRQQNLCKTVPNRRAIRKAWLQPVN